MILNINICTMNLQKKTRLDQQKSIGARKMNKLSPRAERAAKRAAFRSSLTLSKEDKVPEGNSLPNKKKSVSLVSIEKAGAVEEFKNNTKTLQDIDVSESSSSDIEDVDKDFALNDAEVRHMLQFYLCQMRWQYGLIVNPGQFKKFDDEIKRRCPPNEQSQDLESCQELMHLFFKGPARGERWVPWHCATCEQELFLFQEVRTRQDFSEEALFAMSTAFSASRVVPMWRQIILPALAKDPQAIINDPFALFQPGGPVHKQMVNWRAQGNILHTTSYNPYPPLGAKGDKFTDYIAKRHAEYADLGKRAFPLLQQQNNQTLMQQLDTHFQTLHKVGPTMSKVLLVTTHLWYPQLEILDQGCLVGDGAALAFDFLYKKKNTHAKTKRLHHLFNYLESFIDRLEPRFKPMLQFLSHESRLKFPEIPSKSLPDILTIYDLQVQLCEWRKFRKNVDKRMTLTKRSPPTFI
mmetsp:Transcript_16116/g.24197  ORF Transcript_16116/g.24197 Transcript_16116/m.24197 type:complete len:464 (-) Transcript_16116:250-1641(-)